MTLAEVCEVQYQRVGPRQLLQPFNRFLIRRTDDEQVGFLNHAGEVASNEPPDVWQMFLYVAPVRTEKT